LIETGKLEIPAEVSDKLQITYISTNDMCADIMTKATPGRILKILFFDVFEIPSWAG
jgi:hypothetical protein